MVHELAHLGRRDDWTNLLQKLFRALFPLNPALFMAERQLCWEREMACDDAVLDASISPKAYATCLTSLAEKRLLRRTHSLAPGAWQRRSELAERVHRILERKGALRPLRSRPVVAAFLAAYLCAGLALARCPQLVAFTNPASETAQSTLEAHSEFRHPSAHLVPAAFRSEARSAASAHLVDATFRTVVPAVRFLTSPKTNPRVARRPLMHRRSSRFAKVDLVQRRLAQSHFIQAGLLQTRFVESQIAEPLFTQAEAQALQQPAAARTGGQLIFTIWVLRTMPAVEDRGFSYPQLTDFRSNSNSNSSWIVIQL